MASLSNQTCIATHNCRRHHEIVCEAQLSRIVSAGAIESARLLLNSRSSFHPAGLDNEYDQVGRNLQGHLYPRAYGLSPTKVFNGIGPGVTIATIQFNHDNPGIIGGGMLADDFIKPPIDFWYDSLPADLPRWGVENKRFMRDNYTRVMHIRGPVQDIPNPEGRVSVDHTVRDKWGIPVARLSGTTHSATVAAAEFMRERGEQWLRASGCEKVWSTQPGLILSGRQHQAGTCRMGNDRAISVTDEWGQFICRRWIASRNEWRVQFGPDNHGSRIPFR